MHDKDLTKVTFPDLSGRRVVIAGGTGGAGEGIVKAWPQAGAQVIVPSRTQGRVDQFLRAAGDLEGDLHFVVGDYTSFDSAAELADRIIAEHGEITDVVASIGGWWQGKALWEVDEQDWQRWFVGLSTAHMAMARAWIPRLPQGGSYLLILGGSAVIPVPGASLMNMEQASLLMMQRVLAAEGGDQRQIGAEVLGPVATRSRNWVDALDASGPTGCG